MRALILIAQFAFWLLVVRLVLRLVARLLSGARPPARPARPERPPRQVEDLVLDPVCRTYLPRSRAVSARIAGREEHYCSEACRDKAAVLRAS